MGASLKKQGFEAIRPNHIASRKRRLRAKRKCRRQERSSIARTTDRPSKRRASIFNQDRTFGSAVLYWPGGGFLAAI